MTDERMDEERLKKLETAAKIVLSETQAERRKSMTPGLGTTILNVFALLVIMLWFLLTQ